MKRREWEFEYSAAKVTDAAEAKVAYHKDRLEFWQEEKETSEAKLKDSTIAVERHERTGGDRIEVKVDQSIARRLAESCQKIDGHEHSVTEYRRWVAALRLKPEQVLVLTIDDMTYFGIGDRDTE